MSNVLVNLGIAEDKVKKTMVEPTEFLVGLKGKVLTEAVLKEFAEKFGVKASNSTGTGKPREATKLFDKDGNLLGGKCRATGLWFKIDDYNHHHGMAKEADNAKNRLNTEAKKIEKEAEKILAETREATDAKEKLALFEKYDAELAKAKAIRDTAVTLKDFTKKVENFETVEDLAKALNVEVITSAPKEETKEA